jgi:hypothetical protein
MRNLKQYPVEADEAISAIQLALENYTKTIGERGIGDIDGIALLMAEKFIESFPDKFNAFVKVSMESVI